MLNLGIKLMEACFSLLAYFLSWFRNDLFIFLNFVGSGRELLLKIMSAVLQFYRVFQCNCSIWLNYSNTLGPPEMFDLNIFLFQLKSSFFDQSLTLFLQESCTKIIRHHFKEMETKQNCLDKWNVTGFFDKDF